MKVLTAFVLGMEVITFCGHLLIFMWHVETILWYELRFIHYRSHVISEKKIKCSHEGKLIYIFVVQGMARSLGSSQVHEILFLVIFIV